jgi:hypothetical protein
MATDDTGYFWHLGRRYLPGSEGWAVECAVCHDMRFQFDHRADAASWLVSHRATKHALASGRALISKEASYVRFLASLQRSEGEGESVATIAASPQSYVE